MSERDEAVEALAEAIRNLSMDLLQKGRHVDYADVRPILTAFQSEREDEWRKEGPERERTLARSLSAQMTETERLQEREEELEAQLHRALGEGARLRRFVGTILVLTRTVKDLGPVELMMLGREARSALASAPLSERAGALIRSALAAKDYLIPGTEGEGAVLGSLARDIDLFEAELVKGGK